MTDFFKQMIEKTSDGIMYVSVDGTIQYWNRGCELIFGISAKQAIGENLDIIIPERHRERHWTGFNKTARTGESAYADKMLSVPALSASGEKLVIEFSMQMIEEGGEVVGFSSIVRNITEKRGK
ncbi:putative PAS/PAC sensor protein [Denitrovibrio acetiphilus DSM 12809]|uniref:Putative PAS/PAC sensor protein n=1 Tax=Denitrovibrio acetiphilus (strain DSM 12809 / NBRC 114555 / N2460) TaxID=522772 RepID=D4H1R9_DENA2|nr:PAS domain S-box protein [Denitrovibrio acetiphilus]ADD68829.1 putative PAS/PAC sensor protein [Denitrovibrio acetiphilus DSM 12809]